MIKEFTVTDASVVERIYSAFRAGAFGIVSGLVRLVFLGIYWKMLLNTITLLCQSNNA